MQYKRVLLLGLSIAAFLRFSPALAQVNPNSIFLDARKPASQLDVKLSEIQTRWVQGYVISPNAEIRKKHPLITRVGAGVELHYSELYDSISATGKVFNTNEFLSLSEKERKQLVINLLELLRNHLFFILTARDKKYGRPMEKHHLRLGVIIHDVVENDKKERIGLLLPADIGVGQAGYKDGQFLYSENYFLKLKVIDGRAKSGDGTKFLIEREP